MSNAKQFFKKSIDKKCANCGEWTTWDGIATSKCENCNEPMDKRQIVEHAEWIERNEGYKSKDFFTPKPNDGPIMLATRKAAFFFHLVFGGIAWLFIWAFASAPG